MKHGFLQSNPVTAAYRQARAPAQNAPRVNLAGLTGQECLEYLSSYFNSSMTLDDTIGPFLNGLISIGSSVGKRGGNNTHGLSTPEEADAAGFYTSAADQQAVLDDLFSEPVNDGDAFAIQAETGTYRFEFTNGVLYQVSSYTNAAGTYSRKLPVRFGNKILTTWIADGYGYYNPAADVVRQFNASSVINEMWDVALHNCLAGKFDVAGFSSQFSERFKYFSSDAKTTFSQLRDALATGKLEGVLMTAQTYFKSLASATVKGNSIQFTDNSQFTPRDFLCGALTGIFSGLSSVVTVLMAACTPILGAIGAILGLVGQGIDALVGRSWNGAVKASVNPLSPTRTFPFTVAHGEMSLGLVPPSIRIQGAGTLVTCYGVYRIWNTAPQDMDNGVWRWELFLTTQINSDLPADGSLSFTCANSTNVGKLGPFRVTSSDVVQKVSNWVASHTSDFSVDSQNMTDDQVDEELRRRYQRAAACFALCGFGVYADPSSGEEELLHCDQWDAAGSVAYNHGIVGQMQALAQMVWYGCSFSGLTSWGHILGDTNNLYYLNYNYQALQYQTEQGLKDGVLTIDLNDAIGNTYVLSTNNIVTLPIAEFTPYVTLPKYTRESILSAILITTCAVAVTAYYGTKVFLKARSAYRKSIAARQREVEKAWNEYTDPNNNETQEQRDAHYEAYRIAVKKNNIWATLTGGAKYSYVNYWDDVGGSYAMEGISGDPFESPLSLSLIARLLRGN